jgi:hypothetical protein
MSARSLRVVVAASWIAIGGTACDGSHAKPATQLLVLVESDLAIGTDLTHVRAEVRDIAGARSSSHTFELAADKPTRGQVGLPFSFGIVERGSPELQLVVSGLSDGAVVVEQRLRARFEAEKTLGFGVLLSRVCTGQRCGSGQTCYPQARDDIAAGACGEVPDADVSELKPGEDPERAIQDAGNGGSAAAGSGKAGRGGVGRGGAGAGAGAAGISGAGAGRGGAGSGGAGAPAAGSGGGCAACLPGETCVAGACSCASSEAEYFLDADGDGHGDASMKQKACGGAPSGYVTSSDDCCDSDKRAFPGQLKGDTRAVTCPSGGFDFDCDGKDEVGWPYVSGGECCDASLQEGWQTEIPGCGETAVFETCDDACLIVRKPAKQLCY